MRKAQALLYKYLNGKLYCLCLKRSEVDGGFWHVVTGTLEAEENDEDCLKREIFEELGQLVQIIKISPILKQWIWDKGTEKIPTNDYVIEVSNDLIKLNEEHTEYEWLDVEKSFLKYKYDSAKEMINLLKIYLEKEKNV